MKTLSATCPKYIQTNFPEDCHRWQDWLDFVESARPHFHCFESAAVWWRELTGPISSYGRGTRTDYHRHPFPWSCVTRSSGDLARSVDVTIETSDCDIRTILEVIQD